MRYLRPDSRELAVEFSIKTLSPGKAKTGCLVLGVYRGARGAAHALKDLGAKDAAVFFAELKAGARSLAWNLRHLVLGMREAFYRFDQFKTQKKSPAPALASVTIAAAATAPPREALREGAGTPDGG